MGSSPLHQAIATNLRAAYDGSAEDRSTVERATWQIRERDAFLARLASEGRRTLFEVGAGAGHDSQHFVENGLSVVATDLSPQMVAMCQRRGRDARVMDVLNLDLPAEAKAFYRRIGTCRPDSSRSAPIASCSPQWSPTSMSKSST